MHTRPTLMKPSFSIQLTRLLVFFCLVFLSPSFFLPLSFWSGTHSSLDFDNKSCQPEAEEKTRIIAKSIQNPLGMQLAAATHLWLSHDSFPFLQLAKRSSKKLCDGDTVCCARRGHGNSCIFQGKMGTYS